MDIAQRQLYVIQISHSEMRRFEMGIMRDFTWTLKGGLNSFAKFSLKWLFLRFKEGQGPLWACWWAGVTWGRGRPSFGGVTTTLTILVVVGQLLGTSNKF